ncbi:hypothetical protein ILUMI_22560 [Ignelater luminosus]|uniref:Transposase Tc1-like domain-containing protein n=1 Tax=Ignelater luminosus TaxID=2038154 RepID=A0A8K0C9W5_IGNLU|nr:hypothetical protein ILUMI_22560 [Ignelater luminosus]
MSLRAIGSLVRRAPSTIQTVISNYNKTGSVKSMQRSGHPRVFTDDEENFIVRTVKQNLHLTAPQIASEMLEGTNKTSSRFRKKRLNFAENHDKSFRRRGERNGGRPGGRSPEHDPSEGNPHFLVCKTIRQAAEKVEKEMKDAPGPSSAKRAKLT